MGAQELIRAGKLIAARTQLVAEVKAAPADGSLRTMLVQVLLFGGEWDRAERHLDILASQDQRCETGVQVYKNLIAAERERLEVAAGKRRPAFMTTAPGYLEAFYAVRAMLQRGDVKQAAHQYREIERHLSPLSGTLDGRPFTGLRDADDSIPWFLELFVHDRYLWVPYASVRELSLPLPKTLWDTLWAPVRITTVEGLSANGYAPVLYPETAASSDDALRLGRMTDWHDLGAGLCRGAGQHLLLVGGEEKGLLDIREMVVTHE